jgi:PAS domain-containing protein
VIVASSPADATGVLHAELIATLSERASRCLARDSPNTLFLIVDGRVVYANHQGEALLGIAPEEASCRGFEVFRRVAVAPEYLELGQESFRKRSRGEEVPPADCALLTRDGRRIEGVLRSELVEHHGRRERLEIFIEKEPRGSRVGSAPGSRLGRSPRAD